MMHNAATGTPSLPARAALRVQRRLRAEGRRQRFDHAADYVLLLDDDTGPTRSRASRVCTR